mmetsp:Transcript_5381/g.7590  ORF Transcript_5381/g.7590 Transcript_5381/m.7590 type:complete len:217 (+) Transcript_5381:515-1165(+)
MPVLKRMVVSNISRSIVTCVLSCLHTLDLSHLLRSRLKLNVRRVRNAVAMTNDFVAVISSLEVDLHYVHGLLQHLLLLIGMYVQVLIKILRLKELRFLSTTSMVKVQMKMVRMSYVIMTWLRMHLEANKLIWLCRLLLVATTCWQKHLPMVIGNNLHRSMFEIMCRQHFSSNLLIATQMSQLSSQGLSLLYLTSTSKLSLHCKMSKCVWMWMKFMM